MKHHCRRELLLRSLEDRNTSVQEAVLEEQSRNRIGAGRARRVGKGEMENNFGFGLAAFASPHGARIN